MIKHIVMFKLLDEAEGCSKAENAIKIKAILDELPAKITEIIDYEVGINILESARSMDIVLSSSFESFGDLELYMNHPEHVKAGEFVKKRRKEAFSVDFEI